MSTRRRAKKFLPACLLLACPSIVLALEPGQPEIFGTAMLDRLEVRNSKSGNSRYWEGQAWIGNDLHKSWLKTQGEAKQGGAKTANVELLYSRAVTAYWDAQAGVRRDFGLDNRPARDWLAVAFKGLAPYRFDVDASAYLGRGAAARIRTGYTLLLTQRLALLPELEAGLFSRSDPARALGSGLSGMEVNLRLRYEITREFAPYVGVTWSNKYGDTAGFARQSGEPVNEVFYAMGVGLRW